MDKVKAVEQKTEFLNKLHAPNRFQKLEDGWVKDNLLGIEWGPSSKEIMNFKEAQKYCAEVGGRLPEMEELALLADRSKRNPAINMEAFPDTKMDDWHWTGTEVAGTPGCAWMVDFSYGSVLYYHEDSSSSVRPVRSSQ